VQNIIHIPNDEDEELQEVLEVSMRETEFQSVDVVSSDILNRNGKSATMQDQSQGRTCRVFRLIRAIRRVKTLRPVLLYYEM
jgi:hypothetical protein